MSHCYKCKKLTQVYGSRWCSECYYPAIDRDLTAYCPACDTVVPELKEGHCLHCHNHTMHMDAAIAEFMEGK